MRGQLRRVTTGTLPTWSTAGSLAAFAWLADRHLPRPTSRWLVEIALDAVQASAERAFDERVDTRFHLNIYAEEWGFFFCHAGKVSWIRVTDVPFAHARRDDFGMLVEAPSLRDIGSLVKSLESKHGIRFQREHAFVKTDLGPTAHAAITAWTRGL